MNKPRAKTANPASWMSQPRVKTAHPSSWIGKPRAKTANLSSWIGQPRAKTANPSSWMGQPRAKTANPSSWMGQLRAKTANLASWMSQPRVKTANPSSWMGEPRVKTSFKFLHQARNFPQQLFNLQLVNWQWIEPDLKSAVGGLALNAAARCYEVGKMIWNKLRNCCCLRNRACLVMRGKKQLDSKPFRSIHARDRLYVPVFSLFQHIPLPQNA